MILCPDCNQEILPYLKTGEMKRIVKDDLILYQCYFCVNCKNVYWVAHKSYKFKPLIKEKNDVSGQIGKFKNANLGKKK